MKKSIGARTMIFPTPVLVVGSYDKAGKPNAMTVAWGGICCSQPPCVGISLRKATYSYGNIVERKAFTINVATEQYVKEADYFGIATGKKVDKFATTGLTPVKSDCVDAPYIREFPFILECKLIRTVEIGLHTQFIGEILDVKADEDILGRDGLPDIGKIKPLVYAAEIRNYYGFGKFLGKSFSIGKKYSSVLIDSH
ncbi:MAG: flavin reductase family protein [Syntrophorhabdaceae bacterium]|jgi:flavin reductase (DIM6/NTAB) family NADH-FMN oxidoreductase RutF|nr:flavin reductase family protein [Syntrophorhabdaceae bacterium]MDD5245205.1 flavin reductase family protein [Syntrophorhabdaceae bacterium]